MDRRRESTRGSENRLNVKILPSRGGLTTKEDGGGFMNKQKAANLPRDVHSGTPYDEIEVRVGKSGGYTRMEEE